MTPTTPQTPAVPMEQEKRRQGAVLRRMEWAFLAFFLLLALAAWKLIPRDKPRAGDVVVFRDNDGAELVKRIVFVQNPAGTAAPPELIQIPGCVRLWRMLFLDHNRAVTTGRLPKPPRENTLYMMGDNMDNSEDSRVFGPIRLDQVVSQVTVADLAPQ